MSTLRPGRNFESTILRQTLEAFGVSKACTTAYHPQCDGMVEWFNFSLLQMLRAYVDTQNDWEHHFPLVLYAYRTVVHASTGVHHLCLCLEDNHTSQNASPHII